jgi:hypothetical protein
MTKKARARLDKVTAKSFLYDGCHKIFLCADEADEAYARRQGWEEKDLRPFDRDEIERLYDDSCPLRAIWWMDESGEREDVVPQGFEG